MKVLQKFRVKHPRIALAIDIACYAYGGYLCVSPVVANGSWYSAALGAALLLSFALFNYGASHARYGKTEGQG